MLKRISAIFRANANAGVATQPAEDPRVLLDRSYDQQIEMLREVKRGVVEVTAARRRLELQAEQLRTQLPEFEARALESVRAGRDDLARVALERKAGAEVRIRDFEAQVEKLRAEEDGLAAAERRLQAKLDAFRTQKEVLKAQYAAAEASARINEAVTGLSEEGTDVAYAVRRAEEHTAQLRARGRALEDLVDEGVLKDHLDDRDVFDREFDALMRETSIESDLERLRAQAVTVERPRQIEGPTGGGA